MNSVTYLPICAILLVCALGENCDKYGIRLYEDMACKVRNSGGACPSSYDCKLQPPNPNQCVVRGTVYNIGDGIPRYRESHTCEFGCFCNLPRVTCPQRGCGNWAGQPPVPEGCHREYSLDTCCSTGILCPPFNDTTTCLVDGVEYKAGEKFFPNDSCYACICQKGFTGKYEAPFCKRAGCDAQVRNQEAIQKFCAPVYDDRSGGDKRCCPKSWTCPDGIEVIRGDGRRSEQTCKYGDKILNVGDGFEKEMPHSKKIKCECRIPPLLLCYDV